MQTTGLSLYGYDSCPYCRRVKRTIEALGVEIEDRDILREPTFRAELLAARGRGTVPVLRIEEEGEVRWMPESADIIRYLRERFGDGSEEEGSQGPFGWLFS